MKNKYITIDLSVTFICLLGAYFVHTQHFINWDVAWHVEGARRLLAGGRYLVNVFDNNSLYVFAYFFPVIWLQQKLHFASANIVIAYIMMTSTLMLLFCYKIILDAYETRENFSRSFLYYILIFIYFFMPAFNLGHREMVLIVFYMPYFLTALFTINNSPKLNYAPWIQYTAIILAAFGILQNLFYLSVPIFIDIYKYLKTKKFNFYQLLFYLYITLGIVLILIFYPEYFQHIVPMVLCYESGFNFPLIGLFLETLTFISVLTVAIVLINFKKLYQSDDIIITFIAATCSLLIYFFEQKLWYYHLYPALSFVMIILTIIIIKYYEETKFKILIQPRINLLTTSLAIGAMASIFVTIIGFIDAEIRIMKDASYKTNRWINYAIANFSHKKVFLFIMKLEPAYSLTMYANADIKVVSPWSNPWILPYIITHSTTNNLFCNLTRDTQIFLQLATQAMTTNKPDFIVIETVPWYTIFKGQHFDYAQFFSKDKKFAQEFKHYRLYGNFDNYLVYTKRI